MPAKKTTRAAAKRAAKLPTIKCPLTVINDAYADSFNQIKLSLARKFLGHDPVNRLGRLAKALGLPELFLLETGVEAWLTALEAEAHNGLTFPVRIETRLPGDQ